MERENEVRKNFYDLPTCKINEMEKDYGLDVQTSG